MNKHELNLSQLKDENVNLVHELEALKIELEMRNAEIRQVRDEAERAVNKMLECEESYKIIVENSPNIMMIHIDGKFVYLNPAAVKQFGIADQQEYIGKPIIEVVHPDHQTVVKERVDKITNKNTPNLKAEEELLRKDGSSFWVEITGFPSIYEGNNAVYVIAVDITERKTIENSLRISEAREKERANELDALMKAVPAVVLIARSPDCQIMTGNYTAHELLRLPIDNNFSKNLPENEHTSHYKIFNNGVETPVGKLPVQRAARGEEVKDYEQDIVFDDGTRLTLLGNAMPLRDHEDKLSGAVAAFIDITKRKQIEETLVSNEQLFRTLCNFAPIGIFQTDAESNAIYMNPRWEQIAGIPAAEAMGSGWLKVIHPDDREELGREWHDAIATGRMFSYEHRQVTPQGETIWVHASANAIRNPNGTIMGFVGAVEDITELHQSRQEMLKKDKLESIGLLAGGIAHDFNNILTTILGNISLAHIQKQNPEKLQKRLEEAEKATVRAKDLTQQLLTFSRGGEPIMKIVNLADLLKESAGFASHGTAIKIEFVLADDLWLVEADEGQLSQVIHNLILNAVQSMPNGGTVTVGAENIISRQKGHRYVRITVTDRGIGISEQDQERIFDPYFTTKQSGSGLGLATCFSIIQKHGGRIRVTSKLGVGSTFYVSLPAAEGKCSDDQYAHDNTVQGSGRVLIMDDEETVREIAQELLEEIGYTVECVANGSDAVELYRKRKEEGSPYSVVILDLTVSGGMGGKEALSKILEIDPNVNAVVSSGYSTDSVMANYQDYGFSAVLSKPYKLEEISSVMQELLQG